MAPRARLGIVRQAGPFLVVPVLGIVAVWLIGTMRPDPREVASDLTRWYRKLPPIPEPPPPRPRAELIRLAPARAAITATALVQAAMVGVMSITAVELGDNGWADWQVQLLMAAHFIGMFALAYPVGMLADRIGRRRTSLLAHRGLRRRRVRHGRHGRLAADHAVLLPAGPRLGGVRSWPARPCSRTSRRRASAACSTRATTSSSPACAAVSSLTAGALLSGAGYWAVGVVFGTLLLLALPQLLRLQEPTVGVYVEAPGGELAGRPV